MHYTEKQVMLQEHQQEKTTSFIILNNKNDIEHDFKQENQNLEVAYKNSNTRKGKREAEVAEVQEIMNELNRYIEDIQKYSRNSGEIITHQILSELKRTWVSNGVLSETDMYIILMCLFLLRIMEK